jgi:hypothetical protein
VKLERLPAWTEYRVHDDHSGASLASFTAMPLASDIEAAARRVGHAFHNLTTLYARQLFLRDIATCPLVLALVVMVTGLLLLTSATSLSFRVPNMVLPRPFQSWSFDHRDCGTHPKSWSPEIGWPSGILLSRSVYTQVCPVLRLRQPSCA